MKLGFEIPGDPVAQGRPRISTAGGFPRAYDPEKSRNNKAYIKYLASDAIKRQEWETTDKPVFMSINIWLKIPKSWTKKKQQAARSGKLLPTKKPDVTNIVKGIEDALNGLAYVDDSQIVELKAAKYYGDRPHVEVYITTEV